MRGRRGAACRGHVRGWPWRGYREAGDIAHDFSCADEGTTQAFFAHRLHQPSGLTWPATSLQVFDSAMKFRQPPHFCSPFGCAWYCTLACGTLLVAAGAAESALVAGEPAGAALLEFAYFFESQPTSAIGTQGLQPSNSAPRSTSLRGGISSFVLHSVSGDASWILAANSTRLPTITSG